jgi:2-amino-4-hydroxy-6-hydroxymethyldihydropteridine diphosphokinase
MHIAYLLTGGNSGNRLQYLSNAKKRVGEECGELLVASSIYETAAWGVTNQPSFYNQALKIKTTLSPEGLLDRILSIEKSLGRVRLLRYGPRTIDIDILFFDDLIIEQKSLTIPHPELHNRRFALQCLVEIEPAFIHPVFNKSVQQLLLECTDTLEVRRLP